VGSARTAASSVISAAFLVDAPVAPKRQGVRLSDGGAARGRRPRRRTHTRDTGRCCDRLTVLFGRSGLVRPVRGRVSTKRAPPSHRDGPVISSMAISAGAVRPAAAGPERRAPRTRWPGRGPVRKRGSDGWVCGLSAGVGLVAIVWRLVHLPRRDRLGAGDGERRAPRNIGHLPLT
jgi:hypothetical protein